MIHLAGRDEPVPAMRGQSILDACLAADVPMPYNCRSGECAECRAELVEGKVEESPGADPAVFNDADRAKGRILTCLCTPAEDVTIKLDLRDGIAAPKIERFYAHVERVQPVSSSVVQVEVETAKPIDYRPGQYFEWVLPDITPNRSFSAASIPGGERLVFDVRLYPGGKVGDYVQNSLVPGDNFEVIGPYGRFEFTENHHRTAICVAGGTGLAPIKAMIEQALAVGTGRRIWLFYGVQTAGDLYDIEKLERWVDQYDGFSFHAVLSDEPLDSGWDGARGLVTEHIEEMALDGFGLEAYLCGPPPMIDAAMPILEATGLEADDIYADRFSPARSKST